MANCQGNADSDFSPFQKKIHLLTVIYEHCSDDSMGDFTVKMDLHLFSRIRN